MAWQGEWLKKPGSGGEKTFREILGEYERIAYGIGGLTPAEFGDLTPAEFVPYIDARIEREKEQTKMENERIGLICATLQNGIPVVMVRKTTANRKPSDYFGQPKKAEEPEARKGRIGRIYDTMMAWVGATSKGGN